MVILSGAKDLKHRGDSSLRSEGLDILPLFLLSRRPLHSSTFYAEVNEPVKLADLGLVSRAILPPRGRVSRWSETRPEPLTPVLLSAYVLSAIFGAPIASRSGPVCGNAPLWQMKFPLFSSFGDNQAWQKRKNRQTRARSSFSRWAIEWSSRRRIGDGNDRRHRSARHRQG